MADKFGPNNAFHDWLSASAYVRGADQNARVVSKKKHRSKRNSGVSDLENERLEAERIRVFWKLSNRHYRRWMNDRLLRELAPPLDAREIGSLFAPPPWGEKSGPSPFERVSAFGEGSAHDVAAWEPFRNNVDMDAEANALQYRTRHQGKLGNNDRRHNAAVVAWQGVSHRSRDVLRRSSSWHLVNLFEHRDRLIQLLLYFKVLYGIRQLLHTHSGLGRFYCVMSDCVVGRRKYMKLQVVLWCRKRYLIFWKKWKGADQVFFYWM